jgi:two-component system sensor histidine kinase UhpB
VGTFYRFRQNLRRTPILYRIAIGNAFVIAIGAIGGTYITRLLADQAADWWLILIFLAIGTTLSVVINFWIIKNALRPLSELSSRVVQVQEGDAQIDPQFLQPTDPDIYQLAATLDSLVRQLNERNLELRALSERAINALEEERKQIALTLHDDTGQSLSMLIINLECLEDQLPSEENLLLEKLIATRQLAQVALANLRKIVYGLRPSILDDLGLVPAIRWYARTNLEDVGIMVEINANGEIEPLPPALNSTLFRITQEAINNIIRHSQAERVEINLSRRGEDILLEVNDDGQGFDLTSVREEALQLQHLGLLGMQERAKLVGGNTELSSVPGGGTQILIRVPCGPPGEEFDE